MAPVKFGLFKARSRDYQEQPSTENLLQHSASSDTVATPPPGSPIPSTSYVTPEDLAEKEMAALRIDCKAEVIPDEAVVTRRHSACSNGETQITYRKLHRQSSTDATSTSTLQDDELDEILSCEEHEMQNFGNYEFDDGASTSCDANSIQFDETISIAPSEDISIHCGAMKKPKKSRSKEEQQLRDLDMWQASNIEVMQNLLSRSGTLDEQIKWEAIATARGLCTLTDSCTCGDCITAKYLAGVTDGDGGLGAAPLFNAINVGCALI